MKTKKLTVYWLLAVLGVLLISIYPLMMGVRVFVDMIRDGTVIQENYPKYVIPYTPIALAVILGVLLLPLFVKLLKRYAFVGGAVLSVGAFFGIELLFEEWIIVTAEETVTKLEAWQMAMCYQPPGGWGTTVTEYKQLTAVEILMGEYNPMFKLHFYMISVVLILAILNCIYGFAQTVRTGDTGRRKALILQAVATALFLGLCILACFTAFYRDGSIIVSPLSASLMSAFFILLGVTFGIFIGSLLLKRRRAAAVWIPAAASVITTLLMYIGEMILLHGHLYRYGEGFFFDGLPGIVLAPVDLSVILLSGAITFVLMQMITRPHRKGES